MIVKALSHLAAAVRADHQALTRSDLKYDGARRRPRPLSRDLVTRVGLQMITAYRIMRCCREAEIPLLPEIVARAVRFVYGADIHPDAVFEAGVVIVHGMGIAVSQAARVQSGVVLSQNVTLGDGIDPLTRSRGAPMVERDVHIGPGATLLGPIIVGARSKIMPGAVVRESVPPGSLVEVAAPRVSPRRVVA